MAGARILIVEDEYLVAAELEAALEELGYASVGIAQDRESALRLVGARPDVALVDMNLRDGETGPEIADELVRKGIKVLFVTANPRQALQAAAPGAVGVLGKPCREEQVAAAVRYVLERGARPTPTPPPGLTLIDGATGP